MLEDTGIHKNNTRAPYTYTNPFRKKEVVSSTDPKIIVTDITKMIDHFGKTRPTN